MANHGGDTVASMSSSSSAVAPQPERWYSLKLGSSFKDPPSSSAHKFYSLRYEFKPASIDKTQDGSLQKNKENRVTVEFQNNQPGKPKVTFEGSSEDYKDNDGVLFFDGETFRLERLHRAVKRLRHVRQPGESTAAANATSMSSAGAGTETRSPPLGKITKPQNIPRTSMQPVPIEVERIDIGESKSPGPRPTYKSADFNSLQSNRVSISPEPKDVDTKSHETEEHLDLGFDDEDDDDGGTQSRMNVEAQATPGGLDINIPNHNNIDDEIADVDVSDDEVEKGLNAAEALRAQASVQEGQQQQTSSSTSSGSESGSSSSSSGSGSSSSDSDGSDDSASSAGDIEI